MNEALGLNVEVTYDLGEEVRSQPAANREGGGEPGIHVHVLISTTILISNSDANNNRQGQKHKFGQGPRARPGDRPPSPLCHLPGPGRALLGSLLSLLMLSAASAQAAVVPMQQGPPRCLPGVRSLPKGLRSPPKAEEGPSLQGPQRFS